MTVRDVISALPVRAKLVVSVSAILSVVCVVVSLDFLSGIRSVEQRAAADRVRLVGEVVAPEIRSALHAGDAKEVARVVDSISRVLELKYLVVAGDSITNLAAYNFREAGLCDYKNLGVNGTRADPYSKIAAPVLDNGRQVALCYAGIPLLDLQSESTGGIPTVAVHALMLLLCGIVLVFGAILFVTSPLMGIVRTAEEGAKGNIQGKVKTRFEDDFGRLAAALNTMFMTMETTGKRTESLLSILDKRDQQLAQEVDKRKVIEKQIQLSNEIITKASALILVTNSTGGVDYASPSFEHVLGYKPETLLQDGWWKVTKSDGVERLKERNLTAKCACGEHPVHQLPYERQISDARGSLRWILWQDTLGLNKTLIKVGQDITERKLAEEQIREQAALLDITGDAILVRSLDNDILFWNKGAETLYGVKQEEAVGKPAQELFQQEGSGGIGVAYTNVIENGAWGGELRQETREGKKLIVESRWTLMNDKEGKPKSILVVNTDVTDQRQLESQVRRTQRLENIGTLAGGIAHDLNNVLTPILMSIQALQKRHSDEKTNSLLSMIDLSARRGADIVKQVLTFARGTEGERTLLQPKHILREIERIIRETFPRSIDLRFNIPSSIWTITGDATQLHQIVLNLLVNARDAMPLGGTLTLGVENAVVDDQHARKHLNAKPGNYVALCVKDTGTGIQPEVIDKIFDPFFTTKEVGKGTGLGLSTVMTIVKSYGGFITVDSTVGKGTTFKVFIPATNVETDHHKEESHRRLPSGRGESILVVDDELSIREITKETLEAYGYKIQTAKDGIEALTYIEKDPRKFQLVVTDMMMPNMDGGSLIRTLQRLAPDIKIIAVSGITDPETLDKIKTSRVEAFLPKPIQGENLLRILDTILHADGEEARQKA
jgi:two-component system, cell cycle sensor histidine kinase and response regulator CckA